MPPPELLRLSFSDLGALEREIANNLRYGRLFVGQVLDAPVLSEGVLVIVHPLDGRELRLSAQIVMINGEGPMQGTGLALRGFGPSEAEQLVAFARERGAGESEDVDAHAHAHEDAHENEDEDVDVDEDVHVHVHVHEKVRGGGVVNGGPGELTEPMGPVAISAPLSRASFTPPRSSSSPRGSSAPARSEDDQTLLERVRRGPEREARSSDPSVLLGSAMPATVETLAVTVRPGEEEASQLMAAEEDWSGVLEPPGEVEALAEEASGLAEGGHAAGEDEAPMSADEELPPPVAEDDWSGMLDPEPLAAAADDPELDPDADEATDETEEAERTATELQSENRLKRLRSLKATEQLKVARRGELQDRVVIERLYGKQVWEALLSNPRITLPEVARIARKGTVPRPLIESIVDNNAWIRADNVRRALLSNPKLTPEGIQKLLRITPRHELKVIEKGTAFPTSVRDAARKLLRDS